MLTDAQCQVIDQHLMEDVEPRKIAAFLCLHMGLLLGEVTAMLQAAARAALLPIR